MTVHIVASIPRGMIVSESRSPIIKHKQRNPRKRRRFKDDFHLLGFLRVEHLVLLTVLLIQGLLLTLLAVLDGEYYITQRLLIH